MAQGAQDPQGDRDCEVLAILAADQAYSDAYLRGDWPSAAALLAPGYYGVANDVEVDRAALASDFPRIHVMGYKLEQRRVKIVRPDLAVVSSLGSMTETFNGIDISGRYWFSGTWVRIDGRWKLLVEEEVALGDTPLPVRASDARRACANGGSGIAQSRVAVVCGSGS